MVGLRRYWEHFNEPRGQTIVVLDIKRKGISTSNTDFNLIVINDWKAFDIWAVRVAKVKSCLQ